MIMTITRLKFKNQVTLPQEIVNKLHLKENEIFEVDIEKNYIKLIPVVVTPKYTAEELEKINKIVSKEKNKSKSLKPGRDFSDYIKNIR
jgi:bifunctional DNA-binding transcriptional regulator/antitoxin component of YhaV-PrlF toxin-antitoxin module